MTTPKIKLNKIMQKGFRQSLVGAAFIVVLAAGPAAAQEEQSFDTDDSGWMSLDHYKDAVKRGTLEQMIQERKERAKPPPPPPPTAPIRIVELPPPPPAALEKTDTHIKIDTTVDDYLDSIDKMVADQPMSNLQPANPEWQKPAEALKKSQQPEDEDSSPPLNIRLTFLPDKNVVPLPDPEKPAKPRAIRSILEKAYEAPPTAEATKGKGRGKNGGTAPPADPTAMSLLEAFRKQQIDAIQSDRKTLKALQDAISSLGYEKQLDFMTGKDSTLNIPVPSSSAGTTPFSLGTNTPATTKP